MIKLPLPPGTLLSLYNNHERFEESYMKNVPGYYDTGDAGLIDEGTSLLVFANKSPFSRSSNLYHCTVLSLI